MRIRVKKQNYRWLDWVTTWGQNRLEYAGEIDFLVTGRYTIDGREQGLEWRINLGHLFGESHCYDHRVPFPKFYFREMEALVKGLARAYILARQTGNWIEEETVINHIQFIRPKLYGWPTMCVNDCGIDYDEAVTQWRYLFGGQRLAKFLQNYLIGYKISPS